MDDVSCFVVGASYLLGGAPGSRKSGFEKQIALDIARQGKRVLYVPTDRVLEIELTPITCRKVKVTPLFGPIVN